MGYTEYVHYDETHVPAGKVGESRAAPYEKMLLGLLLFIPGSYHTVVAFLACQRTGGFTYDDVCTFEDESWHDKDD